MRQPAIALSLFFLAASAATADNNSACQFKATVKNQTGKPLLVSTRVLPQGTWTKQPASSIASGSQDTFSSTGPAMNPLGTQGWIQYKLDGGDHTVTTIFWNVPWATPQKITFSGSIDVLIQKNEIGCTQDDGNLNSPDWACKHCWLTISVSSSAH